ncbi:hypothetical protein HPB51_016400 [Rhipicephalus microplus]|uniref:RING-type E3 ubiquitin transferase n=1 Tax=Rhipicephalus microplus TaxID=6941 RepID=A0A9J6EAJ1_RHIMP|nr:E3 ubiquitin-protein ligase RING1-like [Rhipicephalus microplus]KAH8031342.1 hypothetical protein HPB51_016400 [Rhipicephalus microplus]
MLSTNESDDWELNAYELQQSPEEVVADDTKVPLQEDSFWRDLRCPICLDILRNTVATVECPHRFCKKCITTALTGNKECPVCQTKVTSKRSLRRDYSLDSLIARLTSKVSNELEWKPLSVPVSLGTQPDVDFEGDMKSQVSEPMIVTEEPDDQTDFGKETNGEEITTVFTKIAASTVRHAVSLKKEDLPCSSSTLAQSKRLQKQQPPNECSESPVSTNDSVASESGSSSSNLRRSELPQDEKVSICCAPAEGEDFDTALSRPATDADSGSGLSVPPADVNNGDDGLTNCAGTSNRRSCTALSDAPLRTYSKHKLVSMTLKPHVDMLREDPRSPTFYLSVSEQATVSHTSAYLKKRLSLDGAGHHARCSPMYCLYAVNMMGDLILLPYTMTLKDVERRVKRPGELLEMCYAKNEN